MTEFHFDYTPYAYVYNNPMNYIDPFGLDSVPVNEVDWPNFDVENDNILLDDITVTPNPWDHWWDIYDYYDPNASLDDKSPVEIDLSGGEMRYILEDYDGPMYYGGYPTIIPGNVGSIFKMAKGLQALLFAATTLYGAKAIYKDDFARFSDKDRAKAYENSKDKNGVPRCYYCGTPLTWKKGSPNSYESDHFFPDILGGLNKLFNLRPSCRTCNRSKGKKIFGKEWP